MDAAVKQAVRDALQAIDPADAKNGGGAEVLQDLVQGIVTDLLQRKGGDLHPEKEIASPAKAAGGAAPAALESRDTPAAPLLSDVAASPWELWRQPEVQLVRSSSEEVTSVREASPRKRRSASLAGPSQDSPPRSPALPGADSPLGSVVSGDFTPRRHNSTSRINLNGSERYFYGEPFVAKAGLTVPPHHQEHLFMRWRDGPRVVLIVAKPGDPTIIDTLRDMATWLESQRITVVLEQALLTGQPDLKDQLQGVRTFSKGDDLRKHIDLIVTIGGDGTLTWATSLFRSAMPPVISFAAGSLGFLTPFPLDSWQTLLFGILGPSSEMTPWSVVCRMRLSVNTRHCSSSGSVPADREAGAQHLCLNEVLVHRGQSGALCKLEVGVDGEHVTLVQGDGLILSTPTGSTAYSLAAGGSMVHPSVPGILLTPVNPHSLSFRPAILPDRVVVTVGVPVGARGSAALSVDGKDVCMLHPGDHISVAMSAHPVPTLCRISDTLDWFRSVHGALHWNRRPPQR